MSEDRTHGKEDAFPRRRLKALCIVILVLGFAGVLVSVLVCFSDDIMRAYCREATAVDGEVQRVRLRHALERRGPAVLARQLLVEALSQTDPEPFIAAKPWSTLRYSMGLRLLSYGSILLGSMMVFTGRRLGLRIMMAACLALMIHGAVEAVSLFQHGQFLASEFYRDLRVNYLDLVDGMGLSDAFRDPLSDFPRRSGEILRVLDVVYFLVMTILWQLAFVCLAWCHVMDAAVPSVDVSAESR